MAERTISAGAVRGTVVTGRNNIFTVEVDGTNLLCRLRGKRLDVEERAYNPLAPADLVEVSEVDAENGTGVVEQRLDRTTRFDRYNRKRNAPQTLAANFETVYCVTSIREPGFRPRFVDRFLVLAEDQKAPAGIIVNKADLDSRGARQAARDYERLGYPVFVVSAVKGNGIDRLRYRLTGRCIALVGQSGSGKSSLVNALVGEDVQTVQSVSARYLRGRHTTNAARLVTGRGMELIDTPGIRELDVRTVEIPALPWCFTEFREYVDLCEHADCAHISEDGCAVRLAVSAGVISPERYESFVRLSSELENLENELL